MVGVWLGKGITALVTLAGLVAQASKNASKTIIAMLKPVIPRQTMTRIGLSDFACELEVWPTIL